MRTNNDITFLEFLLRIWDSLERNYEDDNIRLPPNMIIPHEDDILSLQKLINIVFSSINNYSNILHLMVNRAILTPKKEYFDEINNLLIEQFPSDLIRYNSFDETLDTTEQCF